MSLTFVQSELSAYNGSGLTTTATFTSNPTAGHMLLAVVRWNNAVTITSVQDTLTNTWVQVGSTLVQGTLSCALFMCQSNKTTSADTFTVNWSADTLNDGVCIAEYSGQSASSSLDGTFTLTRTTGLTTINIGPVTASQANESIITIGSCNSGTTIVSSVLGQTQRQSGSTNNCFLLDLAESALGNYSDTLTQGASNIACIFFLTFLSTTSLPVATSTFNPVAGTYTSTQSVTVSNTNSGLAGFAMYYTTDGSTPTTGSTLYTGAITVGISETIKVLAVATGYANSAIASAAYTITIASRSTRSK
jgi:hypothetical protein